ncbi:F0F1 ATP synthase subunit B [Teredinibacter sp. KSP-S5-2]|uniref:F0F1 ATP synthase subunit B n=1 Tax=Teredinibacter sp. KSP-S5-2 TaxID=3034506 RepID=UPI002934C694|nr:F0F1 ATP synthase subunit B [Teredinibacter sp. KSP-S5-2]WNO09115.1 F0F1 ATP synthase subunit B [Teredinibacter sp. KSP-S5-2]
MNINLTLIGQSLTFLVFIAFCMKYVWPALLGIMQEREERIAAGLEAANRADKDLKLAQKRSNEQLHEAKVQAATIVEQANKRAAQIVDEAKEAAHQEADRIKAQAQAEVERQVSQAREELRGKVSVLALAGAEKILGASVDAKAHEAMLEKLAAEL